MVIYEVNLSVENKIYTDYYDWLLEHVNTMLQFNGFLRAEIGLIHEEDVSHKKQIRVNYYLDSYEHLQDYFTNFAAKMRNDAKERFQDAFSIERRVIIEPMTIEA